MDPSPHQTAILDCVRNTEKNIIVQACAGSGKTTTLRMICDALSPGLRAVAVCFNKLNADQFQAKLPAHVKASTMHSLGLALTRSRFGRIDVDTKKQTRIIKKLFGKTWDLGFEESHILHCTKKILPLIRANLLDPTEDLVAVRDLLIENVPDWNSSIANADVVALYSKRILAALRKETSRVDFDDMIDFPVHYEIRGDSVYDVILGDEVQDWNKQQAKLVWLLAGTVGERQFSKTANGLDDLLGLEAEEDVAPDVRPTASRVILVGDEKQSIYAFRGADTKSMKNLEESFGCTKLPLSVCYRCAHLVVSRAQQIVGEEFIQPRDDAPTGKVLYRDEYQYNKTMSDLPEGAMVLCRTNAPLMPAALTLIRQGRKACVRGRDIKSNLTRIVEVNKKGLEDDQLGELLSKVYNWSVEKTRALSKVEAYMAAQAVQDQYECIRSLATGANTIKDVFQNINQVFDDTVEGIVLSSCHKAKGLEAEYVVVLGPELMPHPMAEKYGSDEQMVQESNLEYVAVTRAMGTLVFQSIPKPEGQFEV